MKNIAEMNFEELGKFAITLEDFERMPGIRLMSPDGWARIDDESLDHWEGWPDFNDAATCGCLLAMVRKRYGHGTSVIFTQEGWKVTRPKTKENMRNRNGWRIVNSWDKMPTEVHAMIASLVKGAKSTSHLTLQSTTL